MELNYKNITQKLVNSIRNETEKIGIRKGVLGLSGGVDSAVTAFLLEKALGSDNLIAVLMPYKTSSKESISDALKVANILKIKCKEVNISKIVDAFLNNLDTGNINNVRKGNIMARTRMIIIYDISAEENALVFGTGNRTEILLGYSTLFGDSACAINPLGDLYKTQVWALAEYLGVPESIINKKPSADLWQGQTDEEELGFTYREVDKLLYMKFEENKSEDEILKFGFKKDFIDKVNRRIEKYRFKSQPPLIIKIK